MAPQAPLQHSTPLMTCFGCGPANPDGMHLHSYWAEDGASVIATFHPQEKYNAGIPNVMYGGTVASLIDCHSIWTAIAFTHREEGRELGTEPHMVIVTGELSVKFHAPTPLDQPTYLKAWIEGEIGRKTVVLCELGPEGSVTASGRVLAVRIQ